MRRISLALLAALGITAGGLNTASAADMALKGAAPSLTSPVSIYNWTGFYIGAHVGDAWGTTESSATLLGATIPAVSQTFNGFLGGFQGGYNWQTGVLVLGVEGDFSFAGLKGNAPCVVVLQRKA